MNEQRQGSWVVSAQSVPLRPVVTPAVRMIDAGLEAVLIALLAFMPFAFGSVQPWSHAVVMLGVLTLSIGLTIRSIIAGAPSIPKTWALVPLALFVVLVVAQLIPLPGAWVHVIAPSTLARKTLLLSDMSNVEALLSRVTLSFYPLATEHDLRLILAASTVFITVLIVFRSPSQIVRLLTAIVCIGAAVALLAAAQDLTKAPGIYWCIPTVGGWARAGTFVLYNNFAQYMNLCLGAAIGLLLYCRFQTATPRWATEPAGRRSRDHDRERRSARTPASSWHSWRVGLLVVFIVLGACTVMLSESRGGMLSLFVCFFGLVLLLARHRVMKRQGWFLLVVGGVIFTTLLYVGFDAVCHRLETLHNTPGQAADGRIQYFKDIGSIWRQFPLVGTGLGTHEYVYPAYDHSRDSGLAVEADGDYVQAAEEVGAIGLLLIALFVAIVWRSFIGAIARVNPNELRSDSDRVRVVAYGLGFGLLAVMIHSAVDFGQHLPALGCLSATFCALLIVLGSSGSAVKTNGAAARESQTGFNRASVWLTPSHLSGLALSLALVAATAWACISANRLRVATADANTAGDLAVALSKKNWEGSRAEYVALLQSAEDAVRAEPRDITNQYWLNCYRWQAISHPIGSPAWSIRLTAKGVEYARRIVSELDRSRLLCPCYGPTLAVMGQIEYFALGERAAALRHVDLAYSLWPNHPEVCLAAGSIAAAENHWDLAMQYFRHCLGLGGALYQQIMNVVLSHHQWNDAVELAGSDPDRLLNVIRYMPQRDAASRSLAESARATAVDRLNSICSAPGAPASVLAQTAYMCLDNGQSARASALFRRALDQDYAEVDWRMALAGTLKSQGRYADAAEQVRICLRLRPQMSAATQLMDQLRALPGVHADD